MAKSPPSAMGRFQKVKAEDDEEEERALVGDGHGGAEEADGQPMGQEHWQPAGLCLGCLTPKEAMLLLAASLLFGLISLWFVSLSVNAVARRALATVATSALGARTTVGAVSIAVYDDLSTVSELAVESPDGFGGPGAHFLEVALGVFDLKMLSLLSSTWELQDVVLRDLQVNVEQNADADSNARRVLAHLVEATTRDLGGGPAIAALPQPPPVGLRPAAEFRGLRAVSSRILVRALTVDGIRLRICIRPMCDTAGPVSAAVKTVVVKNVGLRDGGVYLNELIEVVVQAVLIAAMHALPRDVGTNLHASFGSGLRRSLDYGGLLLDLGSGLADISGWTRFHLGRLGHVAGEALLNASSLLERKVDNLLGTVGQEGGISGRMAELLSQEQKQLADEVQALRGDTSPPPMRRLVQDPGRGGETRGGAE